MQMHCGSEAPGFDEDMLVKTQHLAKLSFSIQIGCTLFNKLASALGSTAQVAERP